MKTILSNILAIYRKELQSYFASPLSYAIASVFWLLTGFFFVQSLLSSIDTAYFAETNNQSFDATYQFQSDFLSLLGNLALFFLPILSMGLYAEERRRGTLELLATSPITNWCVATGKLLGSLTFFITLLVPLIAYQAFAFSTTSPPILPAVPLLGHLGLILLAASILSIGLFMSSLTDSTIWAAVFTFIFVLLLWLLNVVADSLDGTFGQVLGHLSLLRNYTNFVRGIFDFSSLMAFASYIFLGLFLTAQSIEALRFQRS